MALFSVSFKASAEKEIRRIPRADLQKILRRIAELAQNPKPGGSVKLSGQECYRLRQGDWRVIYEVDEVSRLIRVFRVAHRKEAYR